MNYYKLQASINKKEIGKYPQCLGFKTKMGDIQNYGLGFFGEIKDPFELPDLEIRKEAYLSHYISLVPINENRFLVLEQSFVNFLNNWNISAYQLWDIEVYYKLSKLTNYKLFHLSKPIEEQIVDFDKTEFTIYDKASQVSEKRKFANYLEYHNCRQKSIYENLFEIRYDEVFLNLHEIDLDMFRLISLSKGNGYYISERLKIGIEEMGFTGMSFLEIEKVDARFSFID